MMKDFTPFLIKRLDQIAKGQKDIKYHPDQERDLHHYDNIVVFLASEGINLSFLTCYASIVEVTMYDKYGNLKCSVGKDNIGIPTLERLEKLLIELPPS